MAYIVPRTGALASRNLNSTVNLFKPSKTKDKRHVKETQSSYVTY
jgi:hypothetical protein